MKQKDIALVVVMVIISAAISLTVSKLFFGSPANREQQVEVVQPITANFPAPDKHYFNKDAFNPTKLITIDPNANTNPFSGPKTQ
jgi:hypothetical protein